jgi:hypothetical protein
MAVVLDQALGALTPSNDTSGIGLERFLGPSVPDLKSLASTALKHLHHAFHRKRPDFDCVIWSTYIITIFSRFANRFSESKGNRIRILESRDVNTLYPWIIQALEAKLMLALVQCEPWLSHLADNPVAFIYPFPNTTLPNYTAYRSVLCIVDKYLMSIWQLGLDTGRSQDIPLWNAWNTFVEFAESRIEILRLTPGGLLQPLEQCHNEMASLIFFASYYVSSN